MSTLNVTTIQHESASGNNIVLDSDGNVEVAGEFESSGKIIGNRDSATSDCFSAQLDGTANAIIRADGRIRIGGTVGSDPNIDLIPDGSITAANNVNARAVLVDMLDGDENAQSTLSNFKHKGNTKLELKTNGNAEFAGNITAADSITTERSGKGAYCLRTKNTDDNTLGFVARADGAVLVGGDVDGGNPNIFLKANGSADFAGTVNQNVTFSNSLFINLDPDDETKVLDVKAVCQALIALKSAAAASTDYASLKAAIATALCNI